MDSVFASTDICWYLKVYSSSDNKLLGEISRKKCVARGHDAVFQKVLIPKYDKSDVIRVELKLPRRAS